MAYTTNPEQLNRGEVNNGSIVVEIPGLKGGIGRVRNTVELLGGRLSAVQAAVVEELDNKSLRERLAESVEMGTIEGLMGVGNIFNYWSKHTARGTFREKIGKSVALGSVGLVSDFFTSEKQPAVIVEGPSDFGSIEYYKVKSPRLSQDQGNGGGDEEHLIPPAQGCEGDGCTEPSDTGINYGGGVYTRDVTLNGQSYRITAGTSSEFNMAVQKLLGGSWEVHTRPKQISKQPASTESGGSAPAGGGFGDWLSGLLDGENGGNSGTSSGISVDTTGALPTGGGSQSNWTAETNLANQYARYIADQEDAANSSCGLPARYCGTPPGAGIPYDEVQKLIDMEKEENDRQWTGAEHQAYEQALSVCSTDPNCAVTLSSDPNFGRFEWKMQEVLPLALADLEKLQELEQAKEAFVKEQADQITSAITQAQQQDAAALEQELTEAVGGNAETGQQIKEGLYRGAEGLWGSLTNFHRFDVTISDDGTITITKEDAYVPSDLESRLQAEGTLTGTETLSQYLARIGTTDPGALAQMEAKGELEYLPYGAYPGKQDVIENIIKPNAYSAKVALDNLASAIQQAQTVNVPTTDKEKATDYGPGANTGTFTNTQTITDQLSIEPPTVGEPIPPQISASVEITPTNEIAPAPNGPLNEFIDQVVQIANGPTEQAMRNATHSIETYKAIWEAMQKGDALLVAAFYIDEEAYVAFQAGEMTRDELMAIVMQKVEEKRNTEVQIDDVWQFLFDAKTQEDALIQLAIQGFQKAMESSTSQQNGGLTARDKILEKVEQGFAGTGEGIPPEIRDIINQFKNGVTSPQEAAQRFQNFCQQAGLGGMVSDQILQQCGVAADNFGALGVWEQVEQRFTNDLLISGDQSPAQVAQRVRSVFQEVAPTAEILQFLDGINRDAEQPELADQSLQDYLDTTADGRGFKLTDEEKQMWIQICGGDGSQSLGACADRLGVDYPGLRQEVVNFLADKQYFALKDQQKGLGVYISPAESDDNWMRLRQIEEELLKHELYKNSISLPGLTPDERDDLQRTDLRDSIAQYIGAMTQLHRAEMILLYPPEDADQVTLERVRQAMVQAQDTMETLEGQYPGIDQGAGDYYKTLERAAITDQIDHMPDYDWQGTGDYKPIPKPDESGVKWPQGVDELFQWWDAQEDSNQQDDIQPMGTPSLPEGGYSVDEVFANMMNLTDKWAGEGTQPYSNLSDDLPDEEYGLKIRALNNTALGISQTYNSLKEDAQFNPSKSTAEFVTDHYGEIPPGMRNFLLIDCADLSVGACFGDMISPGDKATIEHWRTLVDIDSAQESLPPDSFRNNPDSDIPLPVAATPTADKPWYGLSGLFGEDSSSKLNDIQPMGTPGFLDARSSGGVIDQVFNSGWFEDTNSETKNITVIRPDDTVRTYTAGIYRRKNGSVILSITGAFADQEIPSLVGEGKLTMGYDVEGLLTMDLRTKGTVDGQLVMKDTDLFATETVVEFVNHLPEEPKHLRGSWGTQSGEISYNIIQYNQNLIDLAIQYPDMDEMERKKLAAWDTYTGRLAKRLGFTEIIAISDTPTSATVTYGK